MISVVHLVTNLHVVRVVHDVLDHVLQHRVPREDGIDFGVTVLGLGGGGEEVGGIISTIFSCSMCSIPYLQLSNQVP